MNTFLENPSVFSNNIINNGKQSATELMGYGIPDKDNYISNGQLDFSDFNVFFNVSTSLYSSKMVNKTIQYLSDFDKFTFYRWYNQMAEAIINNKVILSKVTEEQLRNLIDQSHIQNTDWKLVSNRSLLEAPSITNLVYNKDLEVPLLDLKLDDERVARFDWKNNPENTKEKIVVFDGHIEWENVLNRTGFYWKEETDELLDKKVDKEHILDENGNIKFEVLQEIFNRPGTTLDNHIKDKTIHITSEERNKWNSKYDKPQTGIPNTDLNLELQKLLNDTSLHLKNNNIHVTLSDKLGWNNKFDFPVDGLTKEHFSKEVNTLLNKIFDKSEIINTETGKLDINLFPFDINEDLVTTEKFNSYLDDFNKHIKNLTDVKHVTQYEKDDWSSRYKKPLTGIPTTDLEPSIQDIINNALKRHDIINPQDGKIYDNLIDFNRGSNTVTIDQFRNHVDNISIHTSQQDKDYWSRKYDGSDESKNNLKLGYIPDNHLSSRAQNVIKNAITMGDIMDENGNINNNVINGLVSSADFIQHVKDKNVHLSDEQRTRIKNSVQNDDLFYMENGTKKIHPALYNSGIDTNTFREHLNNTVIHVTAEDKNRWNSKYDKPVDGINISDLNSDLATDLMFAVNNKGKANGLAQLDSTGKVPISQLPPAYSGGRVNASRNFILANKDEMDRHPTVELMKGDTCVIQSNNDKYILTPNGWSRTSKRVTIGSRPNDPIQGDIHMQIL